MAPEHLVFVIGAALMGACVGSFVNVLIFRLPRGRSVVRPGSHCFCCGTPLAPRDLVPVFSFLLGGRRCRYCGVALSSQYAWVELAMGLLYGALAWRWMVPFDRAAPVTTVTYAVAAAALVAALGTDIHFKIIPTSLNLAIGLTGLIGGLLAWLVPPGTETLAAQMQLPPTPAMALAGAAVGYVVFEVIVRVGRRLFGQEAMGGGDVLLAAAVGTLTGPGRYFGTFFLVSIMVGAVVGIGLMVFGRLGRRQAMPFGPFLVLGALTVMLYPELANRVAALYGLGPR